MVTGRRGREDAARLTAELEKARARIAQLEDDLRGARRDRVTGLPRIEAFYERLEAEIKRARRSQQPLAIALVEVDGLGGINAHSGRAAGDSAIRLVATTLGELTRAEDLICRTGADEFGLLMTDTGGDGAQECADRVLRSLEDVDVAPLPPVSVSIGVADYRRGRTAEQVVADAASALREARGLGGSRVVVYSDDLGERKPSGAANDVVLSLAAALLERDRYTGEHSESLVEVAGQVASSLGLPPEEVERVRVGALLHDIGKVAIPDHILNKPGPLDDEEQALMREHPVVGERILRAIPGFGGLAKIIRHEHESVDGSGYPDGLKGDEIPIGSRIILACDAYHAMTSDRPYRQALPHGEALRRLQEAAGTQFDTRVVGALVGQLYWTRATGRVA